MGCQRRSPYTSLTWGAHLCSLLKTHIFFWKTLVATRAYITDCVHPTYKMVLLGRHGGHGILNGYGIHGALERSGCKSVTRPDCSNSPAAPSLLSPHQSFVGPPLQAVYVGKKKNKQNYLSLVQRWWPKYTGIGISPKPAGLDQHSMTHARPSSGTGREWWAHCPLFRPGHPGCPVYSRCRNSQKEWPA